MKHVRHRFLNPSPPPSKCEECGWKPDCGGLDGDEANSGCFERCLTRCKTQKCDSVCPCSPIGFEDFWREVGGICVPPINGYQMPIDPAPSIYIPQIHNGSGRNSSLNSAWVSLPLQSICKMEGAYLGIRFTNRDEMCRSLKIDSKSKIILSSVSEDPLIEAFWKAHVKRSLPERIAELGFGMVTVPNYSMMRDTPRTHSLHSLSRIFRVWERMVEAGIPTVPHLNAITLSDWKRWGDVLKDSTGPLYLSMEFQTGLKEKKRGELFLARLEDLSQEIGKAIHPVVVGGTGFIYAIARRFPLFTLIDSTPFFKAVKRQMLVPRGAGRRPAWRTVPSMRGECISDRLEQNILLHQQMIYGRLSRLYEGDRLRLTLN